MNYKRLIGGFVAAVLATIIIASVIHSHFTIQGLRAVGAEIGPGDAWKLAWGDLIGLAPTLGAVIAIALLVGFLVAAIVLRFVKLPRWVGYAVAGKAAMITALWLMYLNFDITPIGSARTTEGLIALGLAGAIGGLLFTWFTRPQKV
ncbi:hypothetical protein ACFOMD_08440 [Sphingoaurantiacus capsulatus]|uniref:Uncharacterized protein n=1 Tax=Sphingoaurantiacus capsulatus TaxID=1771310 RepID=A0ABV7XAX5_9SPHN